MLATLPSLNKNVVSPISSWSACFRPRAVQEVPADTVLALYKRLPQTLCENSIHQSDKRYSGLSMVTQRCRGRTAANTLRTHVADSKSNLCVVFPSVVMKVQQHAGWLQLGLWHVLLWRRSSASAGSAQKLA